MVSEVDLGKFVRCCVRYESFIDVVKCRKTDREGRYHVYTITIPSEVVQKLQLKPGDKIMVTIIKITPTTTKQ